jgi:hypothetical protein
VLKFIFANLQEGKEFVKKKEKRKAVKNKKRGKRE